MAEIAARGAEPSEVFTAVTHAASAVLGGCFMTLLRVDDDMATVAVAWGGPAQAGARTGMPPDDHGILAQIMRTRRPVRVDGYTTTRGPPHARSGDGVGSSAGVPVIVDGRIWGILVATADGQLPADAEHRLAQFAALAAAPVANAQARAELRQMAGEQTALRGVAELVARGTAPQELLAAIASETSGLLHGKAATLARFDGDTVLVVVAAHHGPAPAGTRITFEAGTLPDRLRRDGRGARVDDYTRELDAQLAAGCGVAAAVAAPIVVADQVWGMLAATSGTDPLPAGTEHRLQRFAALAAAAIAGVQARAEAQALADEQAALRRVAELAAREGPASEVLGAVAREASRLAGVDFTTLLRYEPDGSTEIVALDGAPEGIVVGMRAPGDDDGAVQRVWRTGQAARIDDLAEMSGHWPQVANGFGFTASASVPILIHGRLWGALTVVGRRKLSPSLIQGHLTNFAELAGISIYAAQTRRELRVLAAEQTALRRVAELVARGAALDEVFNAVAAEASKLLGDLAAVLLRYDAGDEAVAVAVCNSPAPLGLRVPSHAGTATGEVLRTGRPIRVDSFEGTALADIAAELGVTAGVAVPVSVEERVWGALTTSSLGPPLPAATEDRLTQFADLAAAAIANAENKTKLRASRARVVATADETRRRLQRDVHDSAQQRLVHTIITLKLARNAIAAGGTVINLIDEALTNAERANSELRDVVHGILPAALTVGGLRAGLESLAADLALPVEVRISAPRLSAPIETTAYFIIAEALANVVKHARASHAAIDIALENDALAIDVRDDGAGGADPARGTGLTGLLDRVEASEGTLTITSSIEAGTTLHATLPLGRADFGIGTPSPLRRSCEERVLR